MYMYMYVHVSVVVFFFYFSVCRCMYMHLHTCVCVYMYMYTVCAFGGFSPFGFCLAGSDDGTVRLWEVLTGRCMRTLPFPSPPHSLSFSPSLTQTVMAVAAWVLQYILYMHLTLVSITCMSHDSTQWPSGLHSESRARRQVTGLCYWWQARGPTHHYSRYIRIYMYMYIDTCTLQMCTCTCTCNYCKLKNVNRIRMISKANEFNIF